MGGIDEAQETFENLINGIACHYERIGKGWAGERYHAADKYTLEYVSGQLRNLLASAKAEGAMELMNRAFVRGGRAGKDGDMEANNKAIADYLRQEDARLTLKGDTPDEAHTT